MLIENITIEQLNAINNAEAFKDQSALDDLVRKIKKTDYGPVMNADKTAGMAVGIKVGLILAESDTLENLVR